MYQLPISRPNRPRSSISDILFEGESTFYLAYSPLHLHVNEGPSSSDFGHIDRVRHGA